MLTVYFKTSSEKFYKQNVMKEPVLFETCFRESAVGASRQQRKSANHSGTARLKPLGGLGCAGLSFLREVQSLFC